MRILAVDDDKIARDLVSIIAEQAGYSNITTEASAEDALKNLAKSDRLYDCILIDIKMPGIDGIDLCAHIRQLVTYQRTPILMLTAIREIEVIGRAFKAGATDYITKPFEFAEVGAKLRIADELSKARQSQMASTAAIDLPSGISYRENSSVSFESYSPVSIDGLIDYVSLGNYASQMSATDLSEAQVFAILIDQFKTTHATSSRQDALRILETVAEAAVSSLDSVDHMAAYASDGAFVVVANSRDPVAIFELEADIQRRIDRLTVNRPTFADVVVKVSVGRPSRLNAKKNRRVKSSFERAIDRAEFRTKNKRLKAVGYSHPRDILIGQTTP